MKTVSQLLTEIRAAKRKGTPFRQEKNGEVIEHTWPEPAGWEIIDFGPGGDKFGNEAYLIYQDEKSGYIVDVDARDIESGGISGKYGIYGSGVDKKGTFKKFEDITDLLTKKMPKEIKQIWASVEKKLPKKIGNFERSILPYDTDVFYSGKDKYGNRTDITFEDLETVISGGSSGYYISSDSDRDDNLDGQEGTWNSIKNMITIVKGL